MRLRVLLQRLLVGACILAPLAGQTQASAENPAPAGACARLIDERGASPATINVAWSLRPQPSERRRLDAQCDSVGPIVWRSLPDPSRRTPAVGGVAIVSWNVHVGGGDVRTLVRQLESGALTGIRVGHYILLLQEAHRRGHDVPSIPSRLRVPRRIELRPETHTREDVITIARSLGLALYYVPSMRNGREAPFEDRGNAILSTLPLAAPRAIELPMGRQRRIAIAATIQRPGVDDPASALQVGVVHLDPLASAKRLWVFATGWRDQQARTLIGNLDPQMPSVLGADLNTWLFGRWEPASRRLARAFPETRLTTTPSGFQSRGRLDVILYRLPMPAASHTWFPRDPCVSGDTRCGSDHRPIVGLIPDRRTDGAIRARVP